MSHVSIGNLDNIFIMIHKDHDQFYSSTDRCLITKEKIDSDDLCIGIKYIIPEDWFQDESVGIYTISKKGAKEFLEKYGTVLSKENINEIRAGNGIVEMYNVKHERVCPICYRIMKIQDTALKIRSKRLSMHPNCFPGFLQELATNYNSIEKPKIKVLLGISE